MYLRRAAKFVVAAAAVGLLALSGGCAKSPPSSSALSGIRLRVTMRFAQGVNPNYQYFFVINNAGGLNAPGPVPVLSPQSGQPYNGNGFATASDGGASNAVNKAGFTDFVQWGLNKYGGTSQNGYALYHAVGDASNPAFFRSSGVPVTSTAPSANPGDIASSQLTFDIDLAQLVRDAAGNPADAATAVSAARAIRYLQVNIIATDITPTDAQSFVNKHVDSMGNDLTSSGQNSYLTIDATQTRTYTSSDVQALSTNEPDTSDVYPSDNSSLDLRSWSIEIVRTN